MVILEENLQTEEARKIAGKCIGDILFSVFYNAVGGAGVTYSLANSFNEINSYVASGKELDLFNLSVAGVCIGIAAVANQGVKVVSNRLRDNGKKLMNELEKIKELPEYAPLELPHRNPRTCKHRETDGSINYCGNRDVKCTHKSVEDCCRDHPTAGWTRDYLCEPHKVHY